MVSLKPDDDYSLAQDSTISSPTLTLNGDAVMSLEKDAAFTDPGASCSDPEDGALTVSPAGSVDNTAVGLYNLSYTCTDSDGQVDTKYRSVYITDTTAPAVPIFTTLSAPVSTSPITLAGTAEADSVVTLYKDETVVATATATGGTFEFIGVELDEGSNSFTVTATDASSNVSAKSGALVITLDTTAPVFAASTDATDVALGDTIPTLSALCTDASTTTVTNDAGSATFDAEGAKTVLYTCTDAAGNAATQSVSYRVAAALPSDTLAPAIPAFGKFRCNC